MTSIEATGKWSITEVRRSRPYHALIAIGLTGYGLLHLILAWIVLQLIFGKRAKASPEGALSELGQQPLGGVLLWIMAIGLFTLTLWQVLEAVIGPAQPDSGARLRRRLRCAGRAVVYLILGLLAVGIATRATSGSGQGEETITAKLMSVPFGQVLVAAVGAAVIAVGIGQLYRGVKRKFIEDLDRLPRPAIRRFATVGYCVKGVALGIIGGLFIWAAVSYDPKKAGGMDDAVATLRDQPFGSVVLVIMASGFACFGVYCFFWAKMARY